MKRSYILGVSIFFLLGPRVAGAFVASTYYGALAVPGRAYYVDSVNGSDSNNGLSPSQAFKTIAQLTAADAAKPVNHWKLAAGSVWHEQMTLPRGHMTIEAYGSGTKPLLDASDPIATGAWSKTASTTNVYQASITHDTNALGKTFIGLWENGTHLIWETSIANVDATPGSYTLSDTSASPPSPVTLYVHATGNGNPAINGNLYEYASRSFALYDGYGNQIIDGTWTRRNMHNDGNIVLGPGTIFRNALVTDGSYHSVYVGAGATIYNVVANNEYHPSGGTTFIWYATFNGTENTSFENVTTTVVTGQAGSGDFGAFGGHSQSGEMSNISYKNIIATGYTTSIFGAQAANSVEFTNIQARGTGIMNVIDSTDGVATSITIDGFATDNVAQRFVSTGGNSSLAITATNLNVPGCGVGAFMVGAGESLTVTSSTFTNANAIANGTLSSLTFLHNAVGNAAYLHWLNPAPTTVVSDYNNVNAGAHVQWGSTGYNTFAAYQSGTGLDVHSITH